MKKFMLTVTVLFALSIFFLPAQEALEVTAEGDILVSGGSILPKTYTGVNTNTAYTDSDLSVTQTYIGVDASGGDVVLTLPAPGVQNAGRTVHVQLSNSSSASGYSVSISGTMLDYTPLLEIKGHYVSFISSGTAWEQTGGVYQPVPGESSIGGMYEVPAVNSDGKRILYSSGSHTSWQTKDMASFVPAGTKWIKCSYMLEVEPSTSYKYRFWYFTDNNSLPFAGSYATRNIPKIGATNDYRYATYQCGEVNIPLTEDLKFYWGCEAGGGGTGQLRLWLLSYWK